MSKVTTEKPAGFDGLDKRESGLVEGGSEQETLKPTLWSRYGKKATLILFFLLMTAYYIASMVISPQEALVRTMLYAFISLKILFEFVPFSIFSKPVASIAGSIPIPHIPRLVKVGGGGLLTLLAVLLVTFLSPQSENGSLMNRCQSLLGLVVFLFLMFATSKV